jgi:dynein heavy chain
MSTGAMTQWEEWIHQEKPEEASLPPPWNSALNEFQKLIVLRWLREERVIFGVRMCVEEYLGKFYSDPPPFDMKETFDGSDNKTPLVFILSPGTDPASLLLKFANDQGVGTKFMLKWLGQGEGPSTEKLIEKGKQEGLWVCLQNCHLCTSWMPSMEAIVEKFSSPDAHIHPDFRLFLTSMPSKAFPFPVLQASIKIRKEAPGGLRVNML